MSSEGSRTSSSSRLSQFGLYRTIDARTEEFLKLSKKRQIRRGCACAVISTAITVTVVVVILLIYEYVIAVESSLVHRIRSRYFGNNTNDTLNSPFADRLDRSFFGFDQDYYERMPLMVNAMQENSYLDPSVDGNPSQLKPKPRFIITNYSKPAHTTSTTISYRSNGIRRTSPRPFYYEYRSTPPTPFSKTYGSRSWVESYRNAQRLKNLQQVIKYLEKTINAKIGDMYAQPTSTHIAFSGVYVEPNNKVTRPTVQPPPTEDLLPPSSSNKIENVRSNHKVDPLFSFKPESPGDVNMLADGFFRFSPVPAQTIKDKSLSTTPMFRQIRHRNKHCIGLQCYEEFESKILNVHASGEIKNSQIPSSDTPKSFSMMLNLFPIKSTESNDIRIETTSESYPVSVNQIYFTTSKPMIQFRRKSTTPIRRMTTRFKRPKVFIPRIVKAVPSMDFISKENVNEPKVIVHVNVYPPIDLNNNSRGVTDSSTSSSTTQSSTYRYVTEMPMLTSTQVEDYHVGSSGIIPVESRWLPSPPPPDPTVPPITTIPPPLPPSTTTEQVERAPSSTEITSWDALPKVVKFSEEDAKIPDEYQGLLNIEQGYEQPEIGRRNSKDSVDVKDKEANEEENDNIAERRRKLIIKLRNAISTTSEEPIIEETDEISQDNDEELTTVKTYVPQINGHYRNVNQNTKNTNKWMTSSESRKRRLEMSVTGFRKPTYVPQYIEIKRNNTRNTSDENEESIE